VEGSTAICGIGGDVEGMGEIEELRKASFFEDLM